MRCEVPIKTHIKHIAENISVKRTLTSPQHTICTKSCRCWLHKAYSNIVIASHPETSVTFNRVLTRKRNENVLETINVLGHSPEAFDWPFRKRRIGAVLIEIQPSPSHVVRFFFPTKGRFVSTAAKALRKRAQKAAGIIKSHLIRLRFFFPRQKHCGRYKQKKNDEGTGKGSGKRGYGSVAPLNNDV